MNPSREHIEARLTALLLGELPEAEAELLRWAIAQDADLQKLHDELKSTIVLVRETVKPGTGQVQEESAPLKLSESRRSQLLAHFKTPRPGRLSWLRRIEAPSLPRLIVTALVFLLVAGITVLLLIPNSKRERGMYGGGSAAHSLVESVQDLKSAFRTSANNSEPQPTSTPPAANPPTEVTLGPEPVIAPPPARIALPSEEPLATVIEGRVAGSGNMGNAGVISQSIVGYVNLPKDTKQIPPSEKTPISSESPAPGSQAKAARLAASRPPFHPPAVYKARTMDCHLSNKSCQGSRSRLLKMQTPKDD
jgi:hypothetical protein